MGWGGPISHQEIVLTASNEWQTFDVNSLYGVPADATGIVIVLHISATGSGRYVGVRPKGSSDETYYDYTNRPYCQIISKIGTDSSIEVKSEVYTDMMLYAVWYFGDEAHFLATPTTESLGTPGSFEEIDITTHVQGEDTAVAALAMPHYTGDFASSYRVHMRPKGNTRDVGTLVNSGYSAMVPVDAGEIFDFYRSNTNIGLRILGYIKSDSGWAFTITPTVTNNLTANDTYTDLTSHSGKTAACYMTSATDSSQYFFGIRKNGTSVDDAHYPSGRAESWYVVELDGTGTAEAMLGSAATSTVTVFTFGTWEEPGVLPLYDGTIDQSPTGIAKNTYVKIATVAPTDDTLTVTISAEGSDPGDVVVADNVGITLATP